MHERHVVVVDAHVAHGLTQATHTPFMGVWPGAQVLRQAVPSRLNPDIQLRQAVALVQVLHGI